MTDAVIWHDLECGAYGADLPLWRELAARHAGGPVLEIGAGTGRVTLDLARRGHSVIALERVPELAAELRKRAAGLPVEVVVADACDFTLTARAQLCIVPMQTVQLLTDRGSFLRCAHGALAANGLLAIALLGHVVPFEVELRADVLDSDGVRYASAPTALRESATTIVLERRRTIYGAREAAAVLDVVELARIDAASLASEAARVGFRALATITLPPTDDHAGSDVLLLAPLTR